MNKEIKLVSVYKSNNEGEAQIIKGLLEAFDIPSVLKYNAGGLGLDGSAGITIMVPEEKADKARGIIEDKSNV